MQRKLLDGDIIGTTLALAARAPGASDNQRWRWRIEDQMVHLLLDPTPIPPSADSDQRALLLGCGAALHHLCTAFAARGWSARVQRLPSPTDPDHLATIKLIPRRPTPLDYALCEAITQRTEREHHGVQPIPPGYLGLVSERAATAGAVVRQVSGPPRNCLISAMQAATNVAHPVGFAELLVLGTKADDRESRLRAGEAISALLLTATNVGLATCLLIEPLEISELRSQVHLELFDACAHPQAVIAIG